MTNPLRLLARTLALLFAVAAVAPVAASATTAHAKLPLRSSEKVELDIYDAHLSQKCDTEVVATLSGTYKRTLFTGRHAGAAASELDTFDGRITWLNRATGKTYSDGMHNAVHVRYPEGIELGKPARVTVTGTHGGTFPIGGGPAGLGVLVYDATVYATDDQGFAYWFVNGDPTFARGTFDRTAQRICAALK